MYFLGIDLGSSSVKVALVDSASGITAGLAQVPDEEMCMQSPKKGWAEQAPETWWELACQGIDKVRSQTGISPDQIRGVGIAYQMHGLVVVDKNGAALRPSIIWCDSRAVEIGQEAYNDLGSDYCDTHLLNAPGNFTASKLKWVQRHEPDTYARVYKMMLPGDYIAYRLSGVLNTTISGLSEGILWDFKKDRVSEDLLTHYGIEPGLIPDLVDTFGEQSSVSATGASESGLQEGTPILYRAGDQPNNALSLNVFQPGEVAATGGTSGVVYAIRDSPDIHETTRVNHFAHVNYQLGKQKVIGTLLCINGTGIQYRWLLNNLAVTSYQEMNQLASQVGVGSDGVRLIPFGNGAERMLDNLEVGAHILHLDLNRHSKAHLCRAALEGIAFAFAYGIGIMEADGLDATVIRAGNDNLFRAEIFATTLATLIEREIAIYDTTGAVGAARACILKDGDYDTFAAYTENDLIKTYKPLPDMESYQKAYSHWKNELEIILQKH